MAWTNDGRRLAAADEKMIKIWDASAGYAFATSPEYQSDVAKTRAEAATLTSVLTKPPEEEEKSK